jgi:hypothetical protein
MLCSRYSRTSVYRQAAAVPGLASRPTVVQRTTRAGRWEWEAEITIAIATDSVGWLCKEGKDLRSQDGGGGSGSVLDSSCCCCDYGNGKRQQVAVVGGCDCDCDCDLYPLRPQMVPRNE